MAHGEWFHGCRRALQAALGSLTWIPQFELRTERGSSTLGVSHPHPRSWIPISGVACLQGSAQPTNLAPLTQLFAYTQALGSERWLARPKRGASTLVLSLLWLTLAWCSSERPTT